MQILGTGKPTGQKRVNNDKGDIRLYYSENLTYSKGEGYGNIYFGHSEILILIGSTVRVAL